MPSPSIPIRSLSKTSYNFSKTSKSSRSGSHKNHCSTKSSSSPILASRSLKHFSWGIRVGIRRFIIGKRCSRSSDLTEESLEAHNLNIIKHAMANIDKTNKNSPYYRGLLTNYSSFQIPIGYLSPERQSHATTSALTWRSISTSFIVKVKELSSCLKSNQESNYNHDQLSYKRKLQPKNMTRGSSSTVISIASLIAETNLEKKEAINLSLNDTEKPLRESFAEPMTPNLDVISSVPEIEPTIDDDVVGSETTPIVPITMLSNNINEVVVDQEKLPKSNFEEEENREFSWASKYQPKALGEFICNRSKALQLQHLAREGGCDHFIFEGSPGVGKRTMILAMLRETFGPNTMLAQEECKSFKLQGEVVGSIEVHVKESPQHVEVSLSELKGYEKHVIVELIKETSHSSTPNKSFPVSSDNCRAIILYEADKLSTDVLLYLKWHLERNKVRSKIFFCCSDASKLQAIKSLCTVVQLSPPSMNEIVEVMQLIAKKEDIELPNKLAQRIADNSKNNFRQAIRSFEATLKKSYPFSEDQQILTGWEDDMANIAKDMIDEQSPKQLYIIRGKLQNLIEHDVSAEFIFKSLVEELKKRLNEQLQLRIDNLLAEYIRKEDIFESDKAEGHNKREEMGRRVSDQTRRNIQQFLRIEEFIAKFMSCYKLATTKSVQNGSTEGTSHVPASVT